MIREYIEVQSRNQPPEVQKETVRRQDLFCLFLYCLQFSRIRNQLFRWRRTPVTRILAFHDVANDQVRSFREKMEIVRRVANVVSLDDIFAGRLATKKINIAITFDDGYRGWLENVYPVLKDFGMSATFFVSSGLVGLREEEGREFLQKNLMSTEQTTGSLTAEELKRLAGEGFTIGGHTLNHVNLAEVSNIGKLRYEIQRDKYELERITRTTVKYFAYPFGVHRNASIDLVEVLQKSGYQGAVTLIPGFVTSDTDSYFLHRDLARASMSRSVFRARLLGNYDAVMYLRRMLRL